MSSLTHAVLFPSSSPARSLSHLTFCTYLAIDSSPPRVSSLLSSLSSPFLLLDLRMYVCMCACVAVPASSEAQVVGRADPGTKKRKRRQKTTTRSKRKKKQSAAGTVASESESIDAAPGTIFSLCVLLDLSISLLHVSLLFSFSQLSFLRIYVCVCGSTCS